MANLLSFSAQLKRERDRRGWSQADVASRLDCDTKTVGRWERDGKLPRPEYRQRLCQLFGKDAEELGLVPVRGDDSQKAPAAEPSEQLSSSIRPPDTLSTPSPSDSAGVLLTRQEDAKQPTARERLREDWDEAPRVENFYGRSQELAVVKQWIGEQHGRVVAILGMGGVGKTVFAATLVEQMKDAFEYVFWRSLHNAPPLEHILQECIQFVSDQRRVKLPKVVDDQILLLLQYLRRHRCLLVLDNLETLFQPGLRVGAYQEDYEGYGRLIRLIGETRHQSCLVLTGREKPREVVQMEGRAFPVRSLYLPGIGQIEGQQLLQVRGLFGADEHWTALIALYAGNPLALQLIAEPIRGIFGGDIARFLAEEQVAFGDIRDLLEQQFHRLSSREREILYWLAIEREALSLQDIHNDLVRPTSKGELLEALDALLRRSLIEGRSSALPSQPDEPLARREATFPAEYRESSRFTLQPVILEYVTNSLVKRMCKDFGAEAAGVWSNYAMIQAQARDYVRESQKRLILVPVEERLLNLFGKEAIEQKLKSMLAAQRKVSSQQRNYLAGNVLNLLMHLQSDVRSFDFSHLLIRQAYLRQVALPDVNFAHAHFVESIFNGTFGNILAVAFSPNGDVLAAGTATGEIWVYQTRSGMPLLTCQGHTDAVWSLAFGPDGSVLASSSDDQTIRLWDMETGQCVRTLQGHSNRVRAASFSPDGQILASGSDDQTVRLWAVTTGECLAMLAGHADRVWTVAFSPDGQILASGSTDQTIRLWNVATNQCLKTLNGHTSWIRSVVFHPGGRALASGSDDHTVRLWDTESGNCLMTLSAHTNRVWSVAFSPDGQILASGSEDAAIRLWDVNTGQCLNTLQEHRHGVRSVAFSADGTRLASGGDDQCLRLWEVSTGRCLETMQGHTNRVWSVDFSPDGRKLVSSGEDQNIRLWDVDSGSCLKIVREPAHGVRSVAFSPQGDMLASGGEDQTVRLWDTGSGQCLKILQGHTNWVRCVAFNPNGTVLASGGEDRCIHLWDINSLLCLLTLQGHTDWIRSLAFNRDGTMLASGSDDQSLRLWDTRTGFCLKVLLGHTNRIRSVAFSPDGVTLASGSEDQSIRLWHVNSGQCFSILHGHSGWVRSVAFSPDGQILASGSDDSTIRFWDVNSGRCLLTLRGHSSRVRSVLFSPSGDIFASGSDDGTIALWDVQTQTRLRTLIGERPYERMNISGAKGLTDAQKAALRALGAIETDDEGEV